MILSGFELAGRRPALLQPTQPALATFAEGIHVRKRPTRSAGNETTSPPATSGNFVRADASRLTFVRAAIQAMNTTIDGGIPPPASGDTP